MSFSSLIGEEIDGYLAERWVRSKVFLKRGALPRGDDKSFEKKAVKNVGSELNEWRCVEELYDYNFQRALLIDCLPESVRVPMIVLHQLFHFLLEGHLLMDKNSLEISKPGNSMFVALSNDELGRLRKVCDEKESKELNKQLMNLRIDLKSDSMTEKAQENTTRSLAKLYFKTNDKLLTSINSASGVNDAIALFKQIDDISIQICIIDTLKRAAIGLTQVKYSDYSGDEVDFHYRAGVLRIGMLRLVSVAGIESMILGNEEHSANAIGLINLKMENVIGSLCNARDKEGLYHTRGNILDILIHIPEVLQLISKLQNREVFRLFSCEFASNLKIIARIFKNGSISSRYVMKIKACVLRDMIGLSDVRQLVLESVTEIKMAIDQKSIVYANIEVFKLVNILSRIHMMSNRERDNSVVKVLWTVETSLLVQIAIVMMSYTIFSGLSCYRGFNSLVYNDFV